MGGFPGISTFPLIVCFRFMNTLSLAKMVYRYVINMAGSLERKEWCCLTMMPQKYILLTIVGCVSKQE